MQTVDVVMSVLKIGIVNKVGVVRRGPKGYGLLAILRLLLYGVLAEKLSSRTLLFHLRKKPRIWKRLKLSKIPCRRTLDAWSEQYDFLLGQVIKLVGDRYLQLKESEWTILDSTPIRDPEDPDARKGYTSQGPFVGFKVHLSCDEHCVPLRATFTTGNVHDSRPAEQLLAPTKKVGGDSAYDKQELKIQVLSQGSEGYFVHNPRRGGKEEKRETPLILKKVRVCVEQCNSIFKVQVLKNMWTHIKGFKRKATRCLLAVLALQALAIYNLKTTGFQSLKIGELRA
jgi:hypothetical protein